MLTQGLDIQMKSFENFRRVTVEGIKELYTAIDG